MVDVIKFYFSLVGQLLSKIWGSFNLTANVTYLHFFVGIMLILVFISLLRFGFANNGINEIKGYRNARKIENEKRINKRKIGR